jgi:hypothetical protein
MQQGLAAGANVNEAGIVIATSMQAVIDAETTAAKVRPMLSLLASPRSRRASPSPRRHWIHQKKIGGTTLCLTRTR